MADNTEKTPAKKGSWLKKLGIGFGALIALLVLGYFVVTSGAFFKGVILPRVSAMLGANVTVEDATISPFSHVELRGLKVQTTGEPVLQANVANMRYSLMDILSENINVNELTLESPKVYVVQNADGTSNLTPILKAIEKVQAGSKDEPAKSAGKAPQLDLKNLALKNASVRFIQNGANGAVQNIDLSSVNITVDQIKSGISGKFNLSTDVGFERKLSAQAVTDVLKTKATAAFEFIITADLKPQSIKGNTKLDIVSAQGAFTDASSLGAALDLDLTPTDIKKLDLTFAKGNSGLGKVSVSGPFDATKMEGKLNVAVSAIDKQVLNLVGGPMGIDFGTTKIGLNTTVELTKAGKTVNTKGQLDVTQFSVAQKGQVTPTVDLKAAYDVAVDLLNQKAHVSTFAIEGNQNQRPLLKATINKPLTVSITPHNDSSADAISDAELGLEVIKLNLADWKAFTGGAVPGGMVDVKLKVLAQQMGKKVDLDLATEVADLTLNLGSNKVDKAGINVTLKGTVADYHQIDLSHFQVKVTQQQQPAANVAGKLKFDSANQNADVETTLDVNLPTAARLLGRPDVSASSGKLAFAGKVTQKNETAGGKTNTTQAVAGNLKLEQFTGKYAAYAFNAFGAAFDCDVELKNQVAQIRKVAGTLTDSGKPGGTLEISGNYDLNKQAGQAVLKLNDLNQTILGIFASPALAPNKLVSVSINSAITANMNSPNSSNVKGDLTVSNLVVTDPEHKLPASPIAVNVKMDVGMAGELATINTFGGKVALGSDTAGTFDITGSYDTKKEAGSAKLKLVDLNQNALKPFIGTALGDKSLVSVSINADGSATYDAKGKSSVKTTLSVTNLVVNDPQNPALKTPLSASFVLDGAIEKQVLDLTQAQVILSPTARAKNQLTVQGKVDMTLTNAMKANLKMVAESLDITPYYDIFDKPNAATKEEAKPAPKPAPTQPEKEADAMYLPMRQSTVDVAIGQFYLREIAVSNFVFNAQIETNRVQVKPLQAMINGSPIRATADANVGVAGYQYDVALNATNIPYAPFANTFKPSLKGTVGGSINVLAEIKGAGTTGASLKKNLTGRYDIASTNLNLSLDQAENSFIKILVNTIVAIPELIKNPGAGLGNLLGRLTGQGATNPGWVDKFMKAPINAIVATGTIGGGKVELTRTFVESPAFQATAPGSIEFAPVLNDSKINLPVSVALAKGMADDVGLTPSGTPTNAVYVPIPQFFTVNGTLGKPGRDLKAFELAKIAVKSGAGIIGNTGGAVADKVGGVLDLLTGGRKQETNAPAASTNPPAGTNAAPPKTNSTRGLFNNILERALTPPPKQEQPQQPPAPQPGKKQ